MLMKKARSLQKELSIQLLQLEKTQGQQAENEALLKELNNQVIEIKKEIDSINERKENLRSEKNKLEMEKEEIKTSIEQKKKDDKDRLMPEIEHYKRLIEDLKKQRVQNDDQIEKEKEKTMQLTEINTKLESKKDGLREDFNELQAKYIKLRDEPVRLGKGNDNLQIAVNHLQSELDALTGETENFVQLEQREQETKNKLNERQLELQNDFDARNQSLKTHEQELKANQKQIDFLELDMNNIEAEKVHMDTEITANTQKKKRLEKNLNRTNKEINDSLKQRVKNKKELDTLRDVNKQLQNDLEGQSKLVEEKKKEEEKLKVKQKELMDEQKIFIGTLVKKGLEDKTMEGKKTSLLKNISKYKQQV